MTLFDQSAPEGATSEEPSAQPVGQADLDKWREELSSSLQKDFDKRFAGFPNILAERDAKIDDLASVLNELKTADMSDDERVQLEREALAQERAAVAAERELLTLRAEFPDEVDLYQEVLKAPTSRDQIALLNQWRKSQEQPASNPNPTDEGDDSSNQSAIDPNNPAATSTDGMDYEAQFESDPSLADKILHSAKRL